MATTSATASRIQLRSALETLWRIRRDDEVIITTMGSAREWMTLGEPNALDFILVPSAMGHGTSIGLGLALAQPGKRVIVCSGDGSLLMNLGSLASIVAANVPNLVVIVFDNGVYEVTGQQPTASADFCGIARACGFDSVYGFSDATSWADSARTALDAKGPTFVSLNVEPVVGGTAPHSPGPTAARAKRLMEAMRR